MVYGTVLSGTITTKGRCRQGEAVVLAAAMPFVLLKRDPA